MVPTSTSGFSARHRGLFLLGLAAAFLPPLLGVVRAEDEKPGVVGDKVCLKCHREQRKRFPASIHGSLHSGDDSVSCELCHGPGSAHVESAGDEAPPVAWKKLSPEASATRCLKCHGRGRGPAHVQGFLTSRRLARGDSCLTCHDPHAPARKRAAAPAKAAKPKRIGADACLLCHRDRPELVSFPHRERVEDMGGCEACHGPGSRHALSRGDPAAIRNPGRLEPAKANRACLLCHSGKAPPDHFRPAPAKERCADCHTIHPPPRVPAPAAPSPPPGRPPLEIEGGVPPAPPSNPFRMRTLPEPGPGGTEILGMTFTGSIRGGGRTVSVRGSDGVYDQDFGYDSGLRLFAFSLSGTAEEGPISRLLLRVEGIDDPVETYRLDARKDHLWELAVRAKQENTVYRASADPKELSAWRENLGVSLALYPEAPLRVTLGLDVESFDGQKRGGRRVNGAIRPVREPIDDITYYGWVRVEYAGGPLSASLTQGYRRDHLDGALDSETRNRPPVNSLLYDERTTARAPVTTFLFSWKASSRITFDGKLVWITLDTDTRGTSRSTGPGGGAGAVERTHEEVDGDRDQVRTELSATWLPVPDLRLTALVEGRREDSESDGVLVSLKRDPPESAPVKSRERVHTEDDQSRWRFGGEAGYRPVSFGEIRVGYEWTAEDYDTEDDGKKRSHDARIHGPFFGLSLEPAKGLSVDALYRFVKVDEPFTEIGTEDEDQFRVKARYHPDETWSFGAFYAETAGSNQRRNTDVLARAFGVNALWEPFRDLSLQATLDFQRFNTRTDAVRYLAGVPRFGRSRFEGYSRGFALDGSYRVTPSLRVHGAVTWYDTRGDFPTRLFDLLAGAAYGLERDVTVGTDLRFTSYDEDDDDDYHAVLVEIWLEIGF